MATLKRDGKTEALGGPPASIARPDVCVPRRWCYSKRGRGDARDVQPESNPVHARLDYQRTLAGSGQLPQERPDLYIEERRQLADPELFGSFRASVGRPKQRLYIGWTMKGWDLLYAYQVDVLRKFRVPTNFNPMYLGFGQYNDHLELSPQHVRRRPYHWIPRRSSACRISLFGLKEIRRRCFSRFTREEQEKMATWQLHVHP